MNYGLRYEVNSQMTDMDNRLSAIDLTVPGGRFVIASDDQGQHLANGTAAAGRRFRSRPSRRRTPAGPMALLRPSYRRFAPRIGLAWSLGERGDTVVNAGAGVFLNQWAYSVQQALAQTLPFFFAKTINAPADALQPAATTETMLLAPANGSVGGSTMNHDYRTEYAKNVTVGHSTAADANQRGRRELSGFVDRRRGQFHGAQCAGAGRRARLDRGAPCPH